MVDKMEVTMAGKMGDPDLLKHHELKTKYQWLLHIIVHTITICCHRTFTAIATPYATNSYTIALPLSILNYGLW